MQVQFGRHGRYEEWFQRIHLATPESQGIRPDLVRFLTRWKLKVAGVRPYVNLCENVFNTTSLLNLKS